MIADDKKWSDKIYSSWTAGGYVKIDRSLPSEERIKSFIEQIKNPYQFKVGNTVVRVSFANTQNTITDNFINMIASM